MSNNRFTVITFTGPDAVELRTCVAAELEPTQILVETRYSMVSSGTELRVLSGHYGVAGKYPVVPGYSSVGRVVEIGSEVAGYRVDDAVSCRNPRPLPKESGLTNYWGGQAGMQVHATTGENRPVILPDGADLLDYVTVEISAISLRGVTAADPKPGESAAVIGQGLIGAFAAAWLNARGCRVIVADLETGRLQRAARWAAATVDITADDARGRLDALLEGGADIVVESSGSPRGMETALSLVRARPNPAAGHTLTLPMPLLRRDFPRLVVQANYLEKININPFTFFPGEGVTILTPFDRGIDDRQLAVDLHRRGQLIAADFVHHVIPVNEAAQGYANLRDNKNNHFSMVFDWADHAG